LFEGRGELDLTNAPFVADATAGAWTKSELQRLTTFVHSRCIAKDPELGAVMMDGGTPVPGLLRLLSNDDAMALVRNFFDPDWNSLRVR
jgi:hypothetical protein